MEDEKDVGWDGGWEEAVDHGHDLADLMMGTAHPYDRADGYVPAHRWGTRHELASQPFADAGSLDEQTGQPARPLVVSSRGRAASTPKPTRKKTSRPAQVEPPVATVARKSFSGARDPGVLRSVSLVAAALPAPANPASAKTRRKAEVAAKALGLSADVVLRIVRSGRPPKQVAALLGCPIASAQAVVDAYAKGVAPPGWSRPKLTASTGQARGGARAARRPTKKRATGQNRVTSSAPSRRARVVAVRSDPNVALPRRPDSQLAPVATCGACGCPIRPSGSCGCS